MSGVIAAGSVLGFLAGLVASSAVRSVASAVVRARPLPAAHVAARLLAMPAIAFAPPWLAARLEFTSDPGPVLLSYAMALAITMVVLAGHPLARVAAARSGEDDR